jgi:hypothetical protein
MGRLFSILVTIVLMSACNDAPGRQTAPPSRTPDGMKAQVLDAATFFRAIVGEYDILEAGPLGGPLQKFENYVGTVEIFDGEVGLTFPYCPPSGGCLPGYAFFLLEDVTVTTVGTTTTFVATLDDGSVGRFQWTGGDGAPVFVNEQLAHSDGSRKAIEYHLRRR